MTARSSAPIAVIAVTGLLALCLCAEAIAQAPAPDPLSRHAPWRDLVVGAPLPPPAVTRDSPLLVVVVTSAADLSHPEFAGANVTNLADGPLNSPDGTAAASIAAAPANGHGILGIWPGMHVDISPLPRPEGLGCDDVAKALERALDADPDVIAIGYGFEPFGGRPGDACLAQYTAIQEAVQRGVLVVASAPINRAVGGSTGEPATLPHVLSVAATTAEGVSADFTRESVTTDLAAPGASILAAVPPAFDGNGDGYRGLSGTAYAAPMAGAAAAWLLAARPALRADQVATVLRHSARDLDTIGFDGRTGWGMLNLAGALAQPAARGDAREPNEDVRWIDGKLLDRPQPALRGGGDALFARLDRYEDPSDVYRLRLRPRSRARVRLRVADGDPALALYDARASSVHRRRHRLAQSDRRGQGTERLLARNPGGRARTFFVRVVLSPDADGDAAAYRLAITAR